MRRRTCLSLAATSVAAALTLGLAPPTAVAAPPQDRGREPGNGADRNQVAATQTAARPGTGPTRSASDLAYPRQTVLSEPPVNNADASLKLGLVAFHELAPRLNALQAESDRVSVEVIGQSVQGRDLYLVTVTAPETNGQARRQEQIRQRIEENPGAAAKDASIVRDYKAPFLVHGNIHGNEWEGTDGALQVVEELARSEDPAVAAMLRRTRVYAVLSVNPDGRVNNTRANAAGFDMNRDYITASQPEVVATRQLLIDKQPLVFLDMHGYVPGTLIEPATAPHAQNNEYDLYIKHALSNAEGMEAAIQSEVAAGRVPASALTTGGRAIIPFRDWEPGDWDDWPPIFTPMYSMYHGAVGHTIEFPMRVNNASYNQDAAVLRPLAQVNKAVTVATLKAGLAYTDANREQLIRDQIEVFRRGAAGEPRVDPPVGVVPGFGVEDRGYTTRFPRAYVIPAVDGQRSPAAAARLVDHLVANDVRVTRADKAFSLAGRSYPPGTYVVDMHQSKRGLANVMLEAGRDISALVPTMYDISGWSHRLLWGATVDIASAGDLKVVGKPVAVASPPGAVTAPAGSDLLLALVDGKDVAALNELLRQGVRARWTDDGRVVVPAAARGAAHAVADRFGVRFTAARAGTGGTPLSRTVIAAAAAPDELKVLRDMGFEVRPVSTASLNAGTEALRGAGVLYVSSGLVYNSLTAARRAEVQEFLETAGLVTRGTTGATFNTQAGMLTVSTAAGPGNANGVVNVVNTGGAVTSGALPQTFVYTPRWFTNLGPEVTAEQRYAATDLVVAGHWRRTSTAAQPN
ncbi:MAG TPA: M14 family zinc carboxypeptidase, partial [Mycobacteriales bacterium]|nr:M14 family zinc carboxypeptidase [Mycobacteriales bacterium]